MHFGFYFDTIRYRLHVSTSITEWQFVWEYQEHAALLLPLCWCRYTDAIKYILVCIVCLSVVYCEINWCVNINKIRQHLSAVMWNNKCGSNCIGFRPGRWAMLSYRLWCSLLKQLWCLAGSGSGVSKTTIVYSGDEIRLVHLNCVRKPN